MRQAVAALLVAGSLSAPALRLWCEVACFGEAGPATVTVSHCHEVANDPAAERLRSPEDCGDHTQLPAVVAVLKSQRASLAPLVLDVLTDVMVARHLAVVPSASPAFARGSHSPPIPPGTRILRV